MANEKDFYTVHGRTDGEFIPGKFGQAVWCARLQNRTSSRGPAQIYSAKTINLPDQEGTFSVWVDFTRSILANTYTICDITGAIRARLTPIVLDKDKPFGHTQGKLTVWITTNKEKVSKTFPVPLNIEQWYHLAITWKDEQGQVYLDGHQVGESFAGTPKWDRSGMIVIGGAMGDMPWTSTGPVLIDDFAILSQAATPAMLGAMMSGPATPGPTTCLLLNFDNTCDATASFRSGTGTFTRISTPQYRNLLPATDPRVQLFITNRNRRELHGKLQWSIGKFSAATWSEQSAIPTRTKTYTLGPKSQLNSSIELPHDLRGLLYFHATFTEQPGTKWKFSFPFSIVDTPLAKQIKASSMFGISGKLEHLNYWEDYMGVKWLRLWGASNIWAHIEYAPGKYDWRHADAMIKKASEKGVQLAWTLFGPPLWESSIPPGPSAARKLKDKGRPVAYYAMWPPRNLQRWRDFVHAIVGRYKDRVKYWEIWNEPNNYPKKFDPLIHFSGFCGTAKQYAEVLKTAYQACKSADPQAKVVGFAAHGLPYVWIDEALKNGAADFMDICSIHNYPKNLSPAGNELDKHIAKIRGQFARYGKPGIEIWDTESSYRFDAGINPTHSLRWKDAHPFQRNLKHLEYAYLGIPGMPYSPGKLREEKRKHLFQRSRRWYDYSMSQDRAGDFAVRQFVVGMANGCTKKFSFHYQVQWMPVHLGLQHIAYATAAGQLGNAIFVRQLDLKSPLLFGYLFRDEQSWIGVFWSKEDEVEGRIKLRVPAASVKVTATQGAFSMVPCKDNVLALQLGQSPVFVRVDGQADRKTIFQSASPPVLKGNTELKLDWLVIGPFANPKSKGFDITYPVEKAIVAGKETSSEYSGLNKKPATWKVGGLKKGYEKIDFTDLLGVPEWSVSYAYTRVFSPTTRKAQLLIGSDDGIKVWVNGTLAHRNLVARAPKPEKDKAAVNLKSGWNAILVKVENQKYGSGFYLTLRDGHGKRFGDLKSRATDYNDADITKSALKVEAMTDNLITNPGFEDSVAVDNVPAWAIPSAYWAFFTQRAVPKGWLSPLEPENCGCIELVTDLALVHSGNSALYIRGPYSHERGKFPRGFVYQRLMVVEGCEYALSLAVKGRGTFRPFVMEITATNMKEVPLPEVPVSLTTWKTYSATYTPPAGVSSIWLCLGARGSDKAFMDDVVFKAE